ncbi:MAG: hypothetical protein FWF15_09550 [Oscillospiraceae bacterium]|nr:hypothetical protein [Oscillospiraceae bacterium]
MKKVMVNIYYMAEWWDKYFHLKEPRPAAASDDALESMYLKRKRFLYDMFGQFGIGEEYPVMDGLYVNMVTKYGMDLIPHLYGMSLTCQEAGGWMPERLSKERLSKMEPVLIQDHRIAEWFSREKERKIERYGSAASFFASESPTNIAVRLRGEDFYMDLLDDPGFARHVLELSTESALSVTLYQEQLFPPPEENERPFCLGNCNVVLMSPSLYADMIKPFDILLHDRLEECTGMVWNTLLHHCDVPADKFLAVYKDLPRLKSFQASHHTDIVAVQREMPGVEFLCMFNPAEMITMTPEELDRAFLRVVSLGGAEIDLWNIDPAVSLEKMVRMMKGIQDICAANGAEAEIGMVPFVWDELEWAFPRYQN